MHGDRNLIDFNICISFHNTIQNPKFTLELTLKLNKVPLKPQTYSTIYEMTVMYFSRIQPSL